METKVSMTPHDSVVVWNTEQICKVTYYTISRKGNTKWVYVTWFQSNRHILTQTGIASGSSWNNMLFFGSYVKFLKYLGISPNH